MLFCFCKHAPKNAEITRKEWRFLARKKKKNTRSGRPTVMTDKVVGKLELGAMAGLNKTEMCEYAGISRDALYEYLKRNPDFADRIEVLKSHPSVRAKINVSDRIEKGDVELSKWYLERKNRDEFSVKQQSEVSVSVTKLEDIL